MAYTKTNWIDGVTPLSAEKMNNIENGLSGVIAESYRTDAEQNIQLWELEAQVIQDKESMSGWQGQGFFEYQNELDALSNVLVTRGAKRSDGFVTFGTTNMDSPSLVNYPNPTPFGAKSVTFSYDDKYMACTQSSGDYIAIYKRVGDAFSRLPAPCSSH